MYIGNLNLQRCFSATNWRQPFIFQSRRLLSPSKTLIKASNINLFFYYYTLASETPSHTNIYANSHIIPYNKCKLLSFFSYLRLFRQQQLLHSAAVASGTHEKIPHSLCDKLRNNF